MVLRSGFFIAVFLNICISQWTWVRNRKLSSNRVHKNGNTVHSVLQHFDFVPKQRGLTQTMPKSHISVLFVIYCTVSEPSVSIICAFSPTATLRLALSTLLPSRGCQGWCGQVSLHPSPQRSSLTTQRSPGDPSTGMTELHCPDLCFSVHCVVVE